MANENHEQRDRSCSAATSPLLVQRTPRIPPVRLEGRYAHLEPLSLDHVPGLFAAANGPRDTFAFTFVPEDLPSMERYMANALEAQSRGECMAFTVFDRVSGIIKGATRFGNIEFWDWPPQSPHQRGETLPDALEIGWTWYAPDAQRTGLNTEAKLLMLTHAFEVWQVHCVRFKTDARNARSRNAILRLGAKADGVLRGHMAGAGGTIRDSAFFSILDSEWREVKMRLQSLLR